MVVLYLPCERALVVAVATVGVREDEAPRGRWPEAGAAREISVVPRGRQRVQAGALRRGVIAAGRRRDGGAAPPQAATEIPGGGPALVRGRIAPWRHCCGRRTAGNAVVCGGRARWRSRRTQERRRWSGGLGLGFIF
jgi:hypothetical protein